MQIVGSALVLALLATADVQAGDNAWTRLGQPSAAVTSLAVDPQNAGTVYAASGAGLFKSVDEGVTWSALSPGLPCCVVTLVIDPQSPTTLYAVTRIGAVLKSTDSGTSWSALNSGLPLDDAGISGVTSLVIDPRNPNTLYVGRARS